MRIQQSNWITRARKGAGAKGPAQVELLEDIQQVVQVGDLTLPEYDQPGGVKRMVVSANIVPGAGQVALLSIENPIGSSIMGMIYRVEFMTLVNTTLTEALGTVSSGLAQQTPFHQDTRWGLGLISVGDISNMICRVGTPAGIPANQLISRMSSAANVPVIYNREVVLAPNSIYHITTFGQVTIQAINVYWTERPAESGELGLGT